MSAHVKAPSWASWSLVHDVEKQAPASAETHSAAAGPSSILMPASISGIRSDEKSLSWATLLHHDRDAQGASWQDFDEDGARLAQRGSAAMPIDADEMDRLLAPSSPRKRIKSEKHDSVDNAASADERLATNRISKTSRPPAGLQWRFDPLTAEESQALERALQMSKYAPMDPDAGADHGEIDVKPAFKSDMANKRRRVPRINKETGKRVYTTVRGTTFAANRAAQAVLQQLCATMLPNRNFDWILAQLTYPCTDMLGISKDLVLKAEHRGAINEAKSYVENNSLPFENIAIITYALARASNVDLSRDTSILDPTQQALRHRGRATLDTRRRMAAQSAAVVNVFKDLFPQYFIEHTAQGFAMPALRDASSRLEALKQEDAVAKDGQERKRPILEVSSDSDEAASEEERDEVEAQSQAETDVENGTKPAEQQTGPAEAPAPAVVPIAEPPFNAQATKPGHCKKSSSGGLMGWPRGKTASAEQGTALGTSEAASATSKRKPGAKKGSVKRPKRAKHSEDAAPHSAMISKSTSTPSDASEAAHGGQKTINAEDADSHEAAVRRSRRGDAALSDWKMPLPAFWQ